MPDTPVASRWNHNTHYHPVVLDCLHADAKSALDIGTGDGLLAVELRQRVSRVVGIDLDADVLNAARLAHDGIQFIHADVMSHDFGGEQFDLVASIATIHHLPDPAASFQRLADLTAPGGSLAVIDLARTTRPSEVLIQLAGAAQHRWYKRQRGYWEHSAPIAEPSHTFREVRSSAQKTLPDMRWRLLPLWRYALTWTKPQTVQ